MRARCWVSLSSGPTAILASFSGPIEVRIRDERLDRATLEVSHRPLDGTAGTDLPFSVSSPSQVESCSDRVASSGIPSKTLASTLTTSLSPLLNLTAHPRSLILLTLQSLTAPPLPVLPAPRRSLDDEPSTSQPTSPHAPLPAIPLSTKSLALTASSLAAMDAASVGLSGLAVGACVVRSSPSSTGSAWVTDPSWTEERTAGARFGVGWAFGAGLGEASPSGKKPAGEEVVWFEADGAFDEKDVSLACPPRHTPPSSCDWHGSESDLTDVCFV